MVNSMILNEDQKAIQELARKFSREKLLPYYQARERAGKLDREIILEMGRLGLIAADMPEEFGGLGVDSVTTGIIAEELAYGDFNISANPVGASLMGAIILKNAQREVIE